MNFHVLFAPQSRNDLQRILRYIKKRSSKATAEAYVRDITDACRTLQLLPHRGSTLPGLPTGVRKIGFRGRVTIVFSVSDNDQLVTVLGIFYGGRSVEL